jgi:hypothetical protein
MVFWVIIPCVLVSEYQLSGGKYFPLYVGASSLRQHCLSTPCSHNAWTSERLTYYCLLFVSASFWLLSCRKMQYKNEKCLESCVPFTTNLLKYTKYYTQVRGSTLCCVCNHRGVAEFPTNSLSSRAQYPISVQYRRNCVLLLSPWRHQTSHERNFSLHCARTVRDARLF